MSEGTVKDMKIQLRQVLKLEAEGKTIPMSPSKAIPREFEWTTCSQKITEAKTATDNFQGTKDSNLWRRLDAQLTHLWNRGQRLIPQDEEEEKMRSALLKTLSECWSILEAKVEPSPGTSKERKEDKDENESVYTTSSTESSNESSSTSEDERSPVHESPLALKSRIKHSRRKPVPVRAWGLKFNRSPGSMSVNDFLEKLHLLKDARSYTENDLLAEAFDLFSGVALTWFTANRASFKSWSHLEKGLLRVFQPRDYAERLWDEIRNRTQTVNESLEIYLAIMNSYFSRLPKPPSERRKLKVIRRNLRPYLRDGLALQDIKSISDLLKSGRRLEEARGPEMHRPYSSQYKGLLQPDLKPARHTERHSRVAEVPIEQPQGRVQNPRVWCWNCGRQGHPFRKCQEDQRMFCTGCGRPGISRQDCRSCMTP